MKISKILSFTDQEVDPVAGVIGVNIRENNYFSYFMCLIQITQFVM